MLTVAIENDKVVIIPSAKKKDWLLSCSQSLFLAIALEEAAKETELIPSSIIKGEIWECKVESFDGMVAIRFINPNVGTPDKIPIPSSIAKSLADIIRFKAEQAEHKMRIVLKHGRS